MYVYVTLKLMVDVCVCVCHLDTNGGWSPTVEGMATMVKKTNGKEILRMNLVWLLSINSNKVFEQCEVPFSRMI